jgi:ABC-type cobalamin/Fe3+-siderophores transport system ATPase subunit
MRLRSVWISQYKNLREFSVAFEGDGFIDIFVGRNGSGKSNFLEALIRVFDHAYASFRSGDGPTCFSYKLSYQLGDALTTIEWDAEASTFNIDGTERKSVPQRILPDNVLIYYSGQNRSVSNLIDEYEGRLRRSIRGTRLPENPSLIGIGPSYRKLLIVILLLLPAESYARRFVEDKLGILGVRGSFTISVGRPSFATRRTYDHLEPGDLYWGAEGVTREFLDDLVSCIEGGATPGALHNRETDRYTLKISAPLFQRVFAKTDWNEIFRLFNGLKVLDMIEDISMDLTLNGLESSELGHFSDGQFQSVYIYAVAELFKDQNCITLLDEPDAFLHPEWQFDFLKQAEAISDKAARSNHILLSSHSAATLIPSISDKVKFFDIKEGRTVCYAVPKRIAIEKLSSKLIRYTEEKQLLIIINAIQIENKPVFFTEGSIDPIIITEAWGKLYESEIPFIPFYAFSCSYLRQLLQDNRIINEMGGRPVFGLFDLDGAFDQWNALAGEILQGDLMKGKCKKLADKEVYAFLLPVPDNEKIQAQVIKDVASNECFGGSSLCEIEHLFYGDPKTAEFFETEPTPGGGERVILKSDSQKERFARDVIPTLDDRYFEVFRPMFDFIITKLR